MDNVQDQRAVLLFKGGTSLSEVFKVIERFSEDIDLSFGRSDLVFSGDADTLTGQCTTSSGLANR